MDSIASIHLIFDAVMRKIYARSVVTSQTTTK